MRRVWKNRRDAAAEGTAPAGWLDRTFDWLDGRVGPVLNKVPLGRSHYDQETAEREWRERFGDDGFETDGASWESTTYVNDLWPSKTRNKPMSRRFLLEF